MRKILFFPALLLVSLLFSSCYTPKTSINNTAYSQKGEVMNFMLLYVETGEELYEWNEENYERLVNGNFNNMENNLFRETFYKKFRKKFQPVFVHNYSDYFSMHTKYSFEEFQNVMKRNNIDHVLLVSNKSRTTEVVPLFIAGTVIPANSEWNMYQVYLLETDNAKPIWISYGYGMREGFWFSREKGISKSLATTIRRAMNKEELLFAGNDRNSRPMTSARLP